MQGCIDSVASLPCHTELTLLFVGQRSGAHLSVPLRLPQGEAVACFRHRNTNRCSAAAIRQDVAAAAATASLEKGDCNTDKQHMPVALLGPTSYES